MITIKRSATRTTRFQTALSAGDGRLRVARITVGAFGLFAVGYQAAITIGQHGFPAANFFSYFTILSNILAGGLLITLGARPNIAARLDDMRGAMVLCMVVTSLLYNVLLRSVAVAISHAWINEVLHVVLPLAVLLDWLLVPAAREITRRQALQWLGLPVAYLGYSLVRGPVAGWYPYPFVDPEASGGYLALAGKSIVLGLGMAVIALGLANLTRTARRRADSSGERELGASSARGGRVKAA
ncbi:MAG: Pr6Pr family membrane protein [Actinobacteria bacterium]|nr:Pr6Pr family membrane protein [Actinomycetota bacterium]